MVFGFKRRITTIIWILVFATAALTISILTDSSAASLTEEPISPIVNEGALNLEKWDFRKSGIVKLKGDWRIFWNQLLTPDETEKVGKLDKSRWIKVPGSWSDHQYDDGNLPGEGVATYTLDLKLPPINHVLALRLLDICTAYKLFINNKIVAEVGAVTEDPAHFVPRFESRIVYFTPEQSDIKLTLQIADFARKRGGPFKDIQLGEAEELTEKIQCQASLEMFLFGLLLIMAFYHFGLYSVRRSDKSTLFFGLFCLVIAIRTVYTGERIGFNLLFDWPNAYRIDILTVYWAFPLFYLFFKSIYSTYLPQKLVWFTVGLAVANTLIVLFTPAYIYIRFLFPNHLILFALCMYLVYCLYREIRAKSDGAKWAAIGFIVLFIAIINDMLMSNRIIFTAYIVPFGVFAFVLAQSFLLSIRYSKAFTAAETYSNHLKKEVTSRIETEKKLRQSYDELERQVEKRTAEIRQAMEAAKKSNRLKSEFLANISHELRNPMHQILSYSKYGIDKIDRPREKLLHYFHQTRNAAQRLMIFLNDLLDLSRLESGKMNYKFEWCDINSIVNASASDFSLAFQGRGVKLITSENRTVNQVYCDPFKVGQIVRNLLANAIEYGGTSKQVEILVSETRFMHNTNQPDAVAVAVKDAGVGIPADELESIFDKFTQSSLTKTGAGGTGLGLAICREIVEAHKGKIWAENNTGPGSTFTFLLPIRPS